MELHNGSCGNTVYTLTPFQNYPDCNDVGVGVNYPGGEVELVMCLMSATQDS